MSWKPYLSSIFPPFCLVSRILHKIQEEKATVVAVIANADLVAAMANADLVAAPDQSVDTAPNHSSQHQDNSPPSQQPRPYSPLVSATPSTYLPLVR